MEKAKHFDGDAVKISRYFHRFRNLCEKFPQAMQLRGDQILVERLPKVELVTKGGLIVASASNFKTNMEDATTEFGLVLMTGPGQFLEDGTIVECASKPGDVILLPGTTYWYSAFGHIADYDPYSIGRIRDDLVPMWFSDYRKAFEVLSESPVKEAP